MPLLLTPAEARTAAVVGKAVHPGAIRRLHTLLPEAHVSVRHETIRIPLELRKLDGPRDRPQHLTRVIVKSGTVTLESTAFCHPDDNFQKRKGIEIAFRRVLDKARLAVYI